MRGQPPHRGVGVELPGRQRARRDPVAPGSTRAAVHSLGIQELGGRQTLQLRGQLGRRQIAQAQLARGEIEPGESDLLLRRRKRDEQALALGFEQARIGHRAGRDDARDLALDRSLGGRRVADLFADRDRLAEPHQLRQILLDRVVRNAGHGDGRARRRSARGERDVEQRRRTLGVGVEQLVEVPHPIEHELVRMLRLHPQVLLHHRRMGGQAGQEGVLFCLEIQTANPYIDQMVR